MKTQTVHEVKSWPHLFEATLRGEKLHELRRDDRSYKVGDRLQLNEFDPVMEAYTGRQLELEITYMTSGENPCAVSEEALSPEFCILSVRPAPTAEHTG